MLCDKKKYKYALGAEQDSFLSTHKSLLHSPFSSLTKLKFLKICYPIIIDQKMNPD